LNSKQSYEVQKRLSKVPGGLFSPTEIDEGSRLLIQEMDIKPGDMVLDIGCGYGPIGIVASRLSSFGAVHMVDKDFVAVQYANKNIETNKVRNYTTYLNNAFSEVPDMKFDVIVSNLPAKVGNELLYIIMNDAKKTPQKRWKVLRGRYFRTERIHKKKL